MLRCGVPGLQGSLRRGPRAADGHSSGHASAGQGCIAVSKPVEYSAAHPQVSDRHPGQVEVVSLTVTPNFLRAVSRQACSNGSGLLRSVTG